MLSKIEKQQILQVLQHPCWRTIEQFSGFVCQEISDGILIGDTEWETAKDLVFRKGQIEGIKRFINELYKQMQTDDET